MEHVAAYNSRGMRTLAPVAVVVASLYGLFFLVERVAALRHPSRPLVGGLLVNVAVSGLACGAAMLTVRPASFATLDWASAAPFGVIHLVPMPAAVQFVVSLLLMDLSFYWWHVANHRVPLLWRFHNVHHIDPDLDVSTAFRFHFGEVALSTGFRVVQIGAIGVTLPAFLAYELLFQANTLFHHSNVRLPAG